MNKSAVFAIVISAAVAACLAMDSAAQKKAKLIINPKIQGTVGTWPIWGSKPVLVDTMTEIPYTQGSTHYPGRTHFEGVEERTGPAEILIVGFVPDPTLRYAVAYTKDAQAFDEVFPEYVRLRSEGKYMESGSKLFVANHMAVSTKVELWMDDRKIRDLPEEAGSFYLTVCNSFCERHGYHLTFISFDPAPIEKYQHFGPDLSEHVHGSIRLLVEDGDKGRGVLVMDVIEAEMREVEEEPE